jgi:hypothetical protein
LSSGLLFQMCFTKIHEEDCLSIFTKGVDFMPMDGFLINGLLLILLLDYSFVS